MTLADTIKIIDPTAKFYIWGSTLPVHGATHSGWVKGNGWETKITYSEARAWELAADILGLSPVICSCGADLRSIPFVELRNHDNHRI